MHIQPHNVAIIGASGAMGGAFVKVISHAYPHADVHVFSRNAKHWIDYADEQSIAAAASNASKDRPLHLVVVCNGLLHDTTVMPERSLKEISSATLHRVFEVNTVTPALCAKHFLPRLDAKNPSLFAVLCARVGSISDNRLGGWYAYRASKVALNMIVKNAAIEIKRVNKKAIIVSLHPGTVDSALSKPFQKNIPNGKLFTPIYSAQKLLDVLARLTPADSGKHFAWDGNEIPP